MAHELDRNEQTGKKAMFSVKETPWHKEGVLLNEAPNLDEAVKLAGCGFDVVCKPVYVQPDGPVHDPGAEVPIPAYMKSPTGQAVIRLDRTGPESVLAMVGDAYEPLQYRDAFRVLEPLLDQGVAFLETGGTLRGGRDAWMLARFDVKDARVKEVFAEEVVPFGLITSNHGGDASVLLMETPIRVVCANTLGAAVSGWRQSGTAVKVQHRGEGARIRVVEAAQKLFGALVERYAKVAEQYQALKDRILTVEEFTESVLDKTAPLPTPLGTVEGNHLTIRGYDLALDAATKRRDAITKAWREGKGHSGDESAWEAYNGAVEVIDHDSTLFRTRGSRVASLIAGRLNECKTAVLNALVKLS